MNHSDITPFFLIILFSLATAYFIIKFSTFFKLELKTELNVRISNLDGLRGFLALGVFFNHSVLMYYYYKTQVWGLPDEFMKSYPGDIAVPIFFMITGFLFWTKITEQTIDFKKFFIRRAKRLVPLYIFTTSLVILIVLVLSDFTFYSSIINICIQIIRWFSFDFLGTPNINEFKDTYTIQSVYWSLRWEWIFYFSLPLLYLLRNKQLMLIILLFIISFSFNQPHFFNFVLGMSASYSLKNINLEFLKSNFFHNIATVSVIFFFLIFIDGGFSYIQSLYIFIFFISIVYGNDIFGLLKTNMARVLGLISYSIYMIHNIIIWIAFKYINISHKDILDNNYYFWLIISLISIFVVLISAFTYEYIEHKFYTLNNKSIKSKRVK